MPIFAGCTEAPKPRVALWRHVDVNFNFSDLSHRNTNRKLLRGCPSRAILKEQFLVGNTYNFNLSSY